MRRLKLSQNFIRNTILVDKLIRKSGINLSDTVLEIGTGTGVITDRLCKVAGKVISIEKDRKLYEISKHRLEKYDNLKLINGDFLQYKLPMAGYKCFSNIPFNYTADIVRRLLLNRNCSESAYLFMQKEAAERYIGKADVTQISLLIKPIFGSKVIYKFKRNDFKPVPSVDIVLVSFTKRFPPDVCKKNCNLYKDFITFCFNQWKRDVKFVLKKIFTYRQLQRLSRELDFNLNDKPSDLSYKKWLKLFNFIIRNKNQVNSNAFESYLKLIESRHKKRHTEHRTRIYKL